MRLLQSRGFEHVIYLDPDIAVFSTLDTLTNWLHTNSILLTPHQNRPEIDARAVIDNEWTSLKYGVYNLGFVAVRSDTEGTAFANWWAERCRLYCRDDVPNGLFTRVFADQMQKTGITVDQVVRSVRNEVARLARTVGHEQVPAIYDQVEGEFYLKR